MLRGKTSGSRQKTKGLFVRTASQMPGWASWWKISLGGYQFVSSHLSAIYLTFDLCFSGLWQKNGRVAKTVFYVSRVLVYRIFSDTFQGFTNFSEFHRNTFFLRKNTSETLSELQSKGLHKLSERSCLWNKSITNQLLMESQWKPSYFCREFFDCATNTAFYVNRKTFWGNYFSEEISRFWIVLDIRQQKRNFWRKDISMFHKSTFYVFYEPKWTLWGELSHWRNFFVQVWEQYIWFWTKTFGTFSRK